MDEFLPQDEMRELILEFIVESEDVLEGLDQCFIKLEGSPENLDLINEVFRAVHNIKGSAGFLGFTRVVEIAHQSENLLNKLRQRELQTTPETIDIILESIDILKALLREIKNGSGKQVDIEPIKTKLVLYSSKKETCAEKNTAGILEQDRDQTLRIDTGRLDQVMNLVGELVLSRNRLSKILSDIEESYDGDEKIKSILETASNLNLVTTDLQLSVMKMRMVPIKKVFNKFPRIVHDIARKANKKINLEMYGETTEVDKSVIEELRDPLVHIIRNSIDHGIESPADRANAGKPEDGTITLGAFQEDNSIVIQIKDDGKGIDPAAIEKKAREKGLIKSRDTRLTPKEVVNFIFEPDFSTADKVTDISGRGVGMDVVKTNISRINGIIDVSSGIGKGTTITLKIPLTLAIIQVLMVKAGGEIYALPLSSVLETVRVFRDSIQYLDGQEVLSVRDCLVPLVRLSDVLVTTNPDFSEKWVYVVLLAIAEKRIGLIVDELRNKEEVVIKSVGTYLTDIKEISGVTITGDGKICLILDPGSLICHRKDLTGVL